MSVLIRFTCDVHDCDAHADVVVDAGGWDTAFMLMEGQFLLETAWTAQPEGWTLSVDPAVAAYCPDHDPVA